MLLRARLYFVSLVAMIAMAIGGVRAAHADDYRPPEYGYSYGEVEGPRSLAMGGAARAWGWSTGAIASNPANLVAQHVYHFEGLLGLDTRAHRFQYGGAVLDSVTAPLALGAQGIRTDQGNDTDPYRRGSVDVRVGSAYQLGDKLAFGVTGHYLRATQDGNGPLGPSAISKSDGGDAGDPNYRQISFDAGLSLALSESIRLGAVGYNLTNTGSPLMPLMIGGGLGIKLGDATLEVNGVGVDKTVWGGWKARLQLGGEILLADHYPLRLGYSYDQGSRRHAISGGAGYVDKQFAVDAGVRQEVSSGNDPFGRALVFSVGLRYFYESAAPETGSSF